MPPRSKSVQRKRFSFAPSGAPTEAGDGKSFDPLGYGLSIASGPGAGPSRTANSAAPTSKTPRRPSPQTTSQWSPLANAPMALPTSDQAGTTTPTPKKHRLLPMADFSSGHSPEPRRVKREGMVADADVGTTSQSPPAQRQPPIPKSITSWASDFAIPKLTMPGPLTGSSSSQAKTTRPITELPPPIALPSSTKAWPEFAGEKGEERKPCASIALGDVGLGGGASDLGAWAAKLTYSPRKGKLREAGAAREDRYVRNGLADLARREIRKLSTEHTLFEAEQLRPWLATRHEQGPARDVSVRTGSPSSKGAGTSAGLSRNSRREGNPPALVLGSLRILGRESVVGGKEITGSSTSAGLAREGPVVRPGWSPTRRTPQTQVLLECQVLEMGADEEAGEQVRNASTKAARTTEQNQDADKSGRPEAAGQARPRAQPSTLRLGQRLVVLLSAVQAGRASAAETALRIVLARLASGQSTAGPRIDVSIAAWGPIMTMDLGMPGGRGRGEGEDVVDTLVITRFAIVQ